MNRKGSEIRVGITVLAALAVLIGGIMWGKGYKLTSSRYPRIVYFDNISGLETGARVLVNGVNKGKVDEIKLLPDHVEVQIQLDNDVAIYTDARIYIDSPDLMGGKVISIFPGTSGVRVPLNKPLKGSAGVGISDLVSIAASMKGDVKELLTNLNTTLVSINQTVSDKQMRENLRVSLANLSQTSTRLDKLVAEASPHVSSIASNLDSTVQDVQTVIGDQKTKAIKTLDDLETVASDLKGAVADLKGITSAINSQEGTIGRLVYQPDIYRRVDSTLVHLDSLISKFQREGIKTSIHLFGK
jgi:phospholipid/cholesterol/gamma-HCH transport system substrate-binding protein